MFCLLCLLLLLKFFSQTFSATGKAVGCANSRADRFWTASPSWENICLLNVNICLIDKDEVYAIICRQMENILKVSQSWIINRLRNSGDPEQTFLVLKIQMDYQYEMHWTRKSFVLQYIAVSFIRKWRLLNNFHGWHTKRYALIKASIRLNSKANPKPPSSSKSNLSLSSPSEKNSGS